MFMVVANNRFEGPPSNTVEFTTKMGGEDTAEYYNLIKFNKIRTKGKYRILIIVSI